MDHAQEKIHRAQTVIVAWTVGATVVGLMAAHALLQWERYGTRTARRPATAVDSQQTFNPGIPVLFRAAGAELQHP